MGRHNFTQHIAADDQIMIPTLTAPYKHFQVLSLEPASYGYVIKVNRNNPDLVATIENLITQSDVLYQHDQSNFPNIVFDHHLYTPLISKGYLSSNTFTEELDIKSVPTGLNKGETRFVWELRNYLQGPGMQALADRKIYLLRNLSRGKGVGFFEASNFYPDFMLWILDGNKQSITFIDPKGLAMLRPNDFSNRKIQLYRTLQSEIAPRLGNQNIILDAYIISAESYAETIRYFGDPRNPFSPEQFMEHHVLFPGSAASVLIENLMR